MKKLLILLLALFIFTGCEPEMPEENPIVTMTFKDYGTIKIELYPEKAFNTVANFVYLTQLGFFDDNAITRVHPNFVIQGGGAKIIGYRIKGEFASNGYTKNDLKHTKGVISMARTELKDSAGGQFFIMLEDSPSLDGEYAAFGKVIEGMDVIDKIAQGKYKYVPDNPNYMLQESSFITISKVTVDTKGYTYNVERIQY